MELINRVAQSEIEVYDLATLWDGAPIVELDIKPFLTGGLVVREKEFRARVREHAWDAYTDKHVAVFCSTQAIVPTWAYLLVASQLADRVRSATYGRAEDLMREYYSRALAAEDWSRYQDRMVVIKGCGALEVPVSAYVTAMARLQSVARKLMFGEPCSSVPLWRRRKAEARTTV